MSQTTPQTGDSRAGFLYALAAYLLWGFLPLYLKALAHIPPLEVLAHRVIWSVPVALAVLIWLGRTADLKAALMNPRMLGMAAVTAALVSVNWGIYVWAIGAGHTLDAALGYYVNPLFSILLGAVLLKERLRGVQWLAIASAGVAVTILTWEAGKLPVIALGLMLTWVDPTHPAPEVPGALLAFDTGPANAPINDLMRARLGKDHDEGGALAAKGRVKKELIEAFLNHPYFFRMPPKSLDRNDFAALLDAVKPLSTPNALATLTAAAAAAVARGAEHFPKPISRLLVTGGGRHNATLMRHLARKFACPVQPVEAAGLNGDMLEAQAFAFLAVRVMRGMATSCPATTGVPAAVGGGQISRP